ncbi:MAG: flagellar biosynthesis anti-sigma factor FlgM [Treponema sp.]|jgi:negative regulator of flagellin synthesis FlgM|nr:flagellar biosynthesis anti-sigma factor FlgM [Treponema sp.]
MTINSVGYTDSIQSGKNVGAAKAGKFSCADTISVSTDAMEKAELYRVGEIVAATPDVRADRVAELKKKINDPSYINDTILNATADKLMEAFGL